MFMRIAVFGGSFNPIHVGHVNIIRGFEKELNPDKMIIIPSNIAPHKDTASTVSGEHRVKMCELALKEAGVDAIVSRMEIDRGDVSYTINTLKELKDLYPNSELCFLMGEDMFLSLKKWYKVEDIFSLATICCAKRSENNDKIKSYEKELKESFLQFKCIIADIPYIEVSSTEIRQGDFSRVPKVVFEYIKANNLYL